MPMRNDTMCMKELLKIAFKIPFQASRMYVAKKEEDLGIGASATTSTLMVAILELALYVAERYFH